MCDSEIDGVLDSLQAVGLNPIIIDENTNFSELPIYPNPFEGKDTTVDIVEVSNFNEEDHPIELDAKGKPKNTIRNKRSIGARNKAAGHGWEYKLIDYLKQIGYTNVVTTRGNSKFLDAQKVDIMNKDERTFGFLPVNIQAKNESKPTPYWKHLDEMPKDGIPNVVAFKYTKKASTNFVPVGEYALMYLKTWLYYLDTEKKYKELIKELAKAGPGDTIADFIMSRK